MQFFSVSDIGQIRTSNQDFFGNKEEVNLFLVADGMGGHAGGERASHLAVETIIREYDFEDDKKPTIKSIHEVLRESIRSATRAIYREASENQELQQMGTTIVALIVHGRDAILGHVGDSRIYRLRDSQLEQLTVDHSFVQEQIDAGIISASDSKDHRMKNVITRALGVDSDVEVDINTVRIQEGDVFLLCTDGLHGMVTDSDIAEIMNSEDDLETCCRALINRANKNGGKDNVTATLVRVEKIVTDWLPALAKRVGVPVVIVAGLAVAFYLLAPSFLQEQRPRGEDTTPPTSAEDVSPDSGVVSGDTALPINEKAADMLGRAATEIENGNAREGRRIVEELLALCGTQDCNFEASDVTNPKLREMIANSQNVMWIKQLNATDEKIKKHEADLKKYAPDSLAESTAKVATARAAFEGGELFRALNLLNDAGQGIDDAVEIYGAIKTAKRSDAQNVLIKAEQGLLRIDKYKGASYKNINLKSEIEAAKLQEARRRLEAGNYEESIKLAGNVFEQSKQLLAQALEIEKSVAALEQRKKKAAEITEKVNKKWDYLQSDQFAKVGTSLSNQAFAGLTLQHEQFAAQSSTGDYEKIALLGSEFLASADVLIQDTGTTLKKRIAKAETALNEKETSDDGYDKADLTLGTSMLEEAKVLAELQFLSKAYEQLVNLEELLGSMKKQENAAAVPMVISEEDVEKAVLSPLDLKKIVLASEQAGILETYLQRSVELLNANKKTRAKSLLHEHSREKFEEVANLLPSEQADLKNLLDGARQLCLKEESTLEAGDVEAALDNVREIKRKLDQIVAANQE